MDDSARTQDSLRARIKTLKEQLELMRKQRDSFMESYHALARVPFAERHEIKADCDDDIERLE